MRRFYLKNEFDILKKEDRYKRRILFFFIGYIIERKYEGIFR